MAVGEPPTAAAVLVVAMSSEKEGQFRPLLWLDDVRRELDAGVGVTGSPEAAVGDPAVAVAIPVEATAKCKVENRDLSSLRSE